VLAVSPRCLPASSNPCIMPRSPWMPVVVGALVSHPPGRVAGRLHFFVRSNPRTAISRQRRADTTVVSDSAEPGSRPPGRRSNK
jgi:hypothetical protein